jgi:hypothetical protein
MPDEALISEIENMLSVIIDLGGQNERTQIVPNLTIQDANPTNLDGFVIVSDDRDGDNIVAKKVPSVTYTNGDLVNVLFPRGGEAVAFQQGSQSASGDLWEIVPSTTTDIFYDKGNVGIGTDEIPHEGIGWAKVAIDGVDFDEAGPHMQFTTDADNYPVIQIFPWGHDDSSINFDSYYDGSWRSSTTDQNFQILASAGRLRFRYDTGVAAGAVLSWNEGIALRDDGTVGVGTISPGAKVESVLSTGAQLRLSHTTASKFADFTVDTNHDLTIKPSSTGQVIFQPTTDQTNFFQILDADGGTPIVNVDAVSERVGIRTASPDQELTIDGAIRAFSDTEGTLLFLERASGTPTLNLRRSRGTIASPTTVVSGDLTGQEIWSGYDGAAFQISALFRAVTDGAVAAGKVPGRLVYQTTDTNGARATRFTIKNDGDVRIGSEITPRGKLDVDQSSTSKTLPVLYLDQADVSEEVIWIEGESSASTADQSLVDASDYTTPGALLGWVKQKIDDQRVGGLGTIDTWVPFYAIPTA